MKATVLSVILTCVNLLIIEGVDLKNSISNHPADPSRRILFGQPAAVSDFPFLVKLHINGSIGAGSIITREWVMTAGHCVFEQKCSEIDIFPAVWKTEEVVHPFECFSHPDYHRFTYHKYDIGLMKIHGDFLKDGRAKTIPLPPPSMVFPVGTHAVVVGWGKTEHGDVSNGLMKAEGLVEDWDVCNNKYLENDWECQANQYCIPVNMPRRVLCTQGQGQPASGTCFGDSGAPAIINGMVAGVISFGVSKALNCKFGSPSMHTNVVDYLPWIYSYIDPWKDTSDMRVQAEDF